MARKHLEFEITFENVEGEDSKEHLQQAFEMLLKDILIGPEVIEEIKAKED